MSRPRKPRVFRGPASHYARPGETILEFSEGGSSGLLSFRRDEISGALVVEVYRADDDVLVLAPPALLRLELPR